MKKLITFYVGEGQKPQDHELVKGIYWSVPSVSTVLYATQSEEKIQGLKDWRERIGEEAADKIIKESKERGIKFDAAIDSLVKSGTSGVPYVDDYFKNKQITAPQMNFLYIYGETEIDGKKVPLGYKGAIDFILNKQIITDTKTWGKHKVDFSGNKMPGWVDNDYYLQVCAYTKALGGKLALILGSDGESFQEFGIQDIEPYVSQFQERLEKFIIEKKGNYFTKK